MASRIPLRKIVIAGALGAVAIVLGATRIGFIPWVLGPGFELTVMAVPVIIGAVLEGPVVGLAVGAIFGAFSMIQDTSGLFKNPLTALLPRMLVGVVAWLAYIPFAKRFPRVGAAVAGVAGSLTNTVLVLGSLALLYPKAVSFDLAVKVGITNGFMEAAIAAVLTVAVVALWLGIEKKGGTARLADEEK
ncbi:MAG TPA: ECF transporter S component [Rectinemataceae bacterium]|nr:ECF transporter S component [Rectinemataceae bacterium]